MNKLIEDLEKKIDVCNMYDIPHEHLDEQLKELREAEEVAPKEEEVQEDAPFLGVLLFPEVNKEDFNHEINNLCDRFACRCYHVHLK